MRFLVVDDSSVSMFVLRSLLVGHDIVEADSAETAGRLLAVGPYDLIICDQVLGGESGVDFVRRCRSVGIDSPILLISGACEDDRDDVRKTIAGGLDNVAFLNKPIVEDDLRKTIRDLLRITA